MMKRVDSLDQSHRAFIVGVRATNFLSGPTLGRTTGRSET